MNLTKASTRISNFTKYLILLVRKHRFLGKLYLVFFGIILGFQLFFTSPKSPLEASSNINPVTSGNYPSPIANTSQAKVFKNGDRITIRWDKPVFDVVFRADNRRIKPDRYNCQLDFCTIDNWNQKSEILKARWTENGQLFSQQFRF